MIPVAPATRDGWSFAGGDLSVQASNQSWHRRATVPELQALLREKPGTKDQTVHWYEAQLLHYGIPSSRVKSTAKLRLLQAVGSGDLTVPKEIAKVEAELKKEYNKREREAKQALKAATASTDKGKKRTAGSAGLSGGTNVNINLSVSVNRDGSFDLGPAAAEPAAKKAKAANKAKSATAKTWTPSSPAKPSPSVKPATPHRTKQTARCSSRGGSTLSGRLAAPTHSPSYLDGRNDDPPPPYPGLPANGKSGYDLDTASGHSAGFSGQNTKKGYGSSPQKGPSSSLPPLGLLNGRYTIDFRSGPFADGVSHLIMTLDGHALWGYFDFGGGVLRGLLRFDKRPFQASWDRVPFCWRGEDDQGMEHDKAQDGSFLTFMGEGQINGGIYFHGRRVEFDGERISGPQTRSEISVAEMRTMWESRFF